MRIIIDVGPVGAVPAAFSADVHLQPCTSPTPVVAPQECSFSFPWPAKASSSGLTIGPVIGGADQARVLILSSLRRAWSCVVVAPLGRGLLQVDVSVRPVLGEVGVCGERRMSRVISLGAKTRKGGPQKPVPRLV